MSRPAGGQLSKLFKGLVRGHWRALADTGRRVWVKAYNSRRGPAQEHAEARRGPAPVDASQLNLFDAVHPEEPEASGAAEAVLKPAPEPTAEQTRRREKVAAAVHALDKAERTAIMLSKGTPIGEVVREPARHLLNDLQRLANFVDDPDGMSYRAAIGQASASVHALLQSVYSAQARQGNKGLTSDARTIVENARVAAELVIGVLDTLEREDPAVPDTPAAEPSDFPHAVLPNKGGWDVKERATKLRAPLDLPPSWPLDTFFGQRVTNVAFRVWDHFEAGQTDRMKEALDDLIHLAGKVASEHGVHLKPSWALSETEHATMPALQWANQAMATSLAEWIEQAVATSNNKRRMNAQAQKRAQRGEVPEGTYECGVPGEDREAAEWFADRGIKVVTGKHRNCEMRLPRPGEATAVQKHMARLEQALGEGDHRRFYENLVVGFYGTQRIKKTAWADCWRWKDGERKGSIMRFSATAGVALAHEFAHHLQNVGVFDKLHEQIASLEEWHHTEQIRQAKAEGRQPQYPSKPLYEIPEDYYTSRWQGTPAAKKKHLEYLARPVEMSARLFENWVADRLLAQEGMVNAETRNVQQRVGYYSKEAKEQLYPLLEAALKEAGIMKGLGELLTTAEGREALKSLVKGHWRTNKAGRRVWVRPFQDKRSRRQREAAAPREAALSPEEDYRANGVHARAFKAWFGDWEQAPEQASKVVDREGKPLVVYHGTPHGGFEAFEHKGLRDGGYFGAGYYFTADPDVAKNFTSKRTADKVKHEGKSQVYKVYLNIRNPFRLRDATPERVRALIDLTRKERGLGPIEDQQWEGYAQGIREAHAKWGGNEVGLSHDLSSLIGNLAHLAEAGGYDGIISEDVEGGTYLAFRPEQVKSVSNAGTFDPTTPDLAKSVDGPPEIPSALRANPYFVGPVRRACEELVAEGARGDLVGAHAAIHEAQKRLGPRPDGRNAAMAQKAWEEVNSWVESFDGWVAQASEDADARAEDRRPDRQIAKAMPGRRRHRKKSKFQKLQENKVALTPEERAEVMDRKAVWRHGPNGAPSPAVWKSVDPKTGKVTFVTNTHRAYNTAPTLKGAIGRYHKFIKGTA